MRRGFTLFETLACVVAFSAVLVLVAPAIWKAYERAGVATSAANIRALTVGGMQYLADNDHYFWKYRESGYTVSSDDGSTQNGNRWWFGFESTSSGGSGEGNRTFDPSQSPLAGYVPRGIQPDPSFAAHAAAFKPKFKCGYIGVGYNVLLGGGWSASSRTRTMNYWKLSDPSQVVVFTSSAQVNNFQFPASSSHPMLEEFYGIDQNEKTVHFRYGKMAMVGYADGSCGFLPMDESSRDTRIKGVNIGRFAPVGSFKYLK